MTLTVLAFDANDLVPPAPEPDAVAIVHVVAGVQPPAAGLRSLAPAPLHRWCGSSPQGPVSTWRLFAAAVAVAWLPGPMSSAPLLAAVLARGRRRAPAGSRLSSGLTLGP